MKQNLYPVMFNPLGGTSLWTPYDDVRCGRVDKAEHYAHGERLLVSTDQPLFFIFCRIHF